MCCKDEVITKRGEPGPKGDRGPAGPQGIQGIQGPMGPPGVSNTPYRIDFTETPLLISTPIYIVTSYPLNTKIFELIARGENIVGGDITIGFEVDDESYFTGSSTEINDFEKFESPSQKTTVVNRRIKLTTSVSNVTSGILNFTLNTI